MNTIYVVQAIDQYEGAELLRAFTTKEAANEFQKTCQAYLDTRPRFAGPVNALGYDQHMERLRAWEQAAPKGFARCDFFTVEPIGLEGA